MKHSTRFELKRLLGLCSVGFCIVATLHSNANAYNVSPYFSGSETVYSKWGDPHAGTPSGVITWSLMADGAGVSPALPEWVRNSVHGTSSLGSVWAQVGGEAAALDLIREAMAGWEAVTNLEFVYLGVDDGTPFGALVDSNQRVGDIRIGGFAIDGFSAAVGYVPFPPSGSTQGGDILFNTNAGISLYSAPEGEGELYDLFPPGGGLYRNEFRGLFAHELGHALGLLHSDVPSGLMCGYVNEGFDGGPCAYFDPDQDGRAPVNRLPDADDVAGIQFLYGLREPNADFDGNGAIDGIDFLIWQRGIRGDVGALRAHGNANGDLSVDIDDLNVWTTQFGGPSNGVQPAAQAVPEPCSCWLLSMAYLSRTLVRRRTVRPPLVRSPFSWSGGSQPTFRITPITTPKTCTLRL